MLTFFSYLLPDDPIHGPRFQLNSIKWLANIAGVALIVGTSLIQGTVKGSSVKLSDAIKVSDGSRVIVTILGANTKIEDEFLSEELENEDVEFVRACRGGLAKQLQKDH